MKKPKIIAENELFIMGNQLFSYVIKNGGIVLKVSNEPNTYNPKKTTVTKYFIAPTKIEVMAYFIQKGYSEISAIKFFDYYEAAQWKDGNGKQVKNWKQKAIGVWFRDENKIKTTTASNDMVR